MGKEYLEAFHRIMETYGNTNSLEGTYNDFLRIKQALQRLEAIENTNPSEAIQGVDVLYANAIDLTTENTKYLPEYLKPIRDKIKQSLLKSQEQEKKLDFLEDALDLPTNCFSIFENRNGDEVTIMRRERYEEYQEQEKVLKWLCDFLFLEPKQIGDKYYIKYMNREEGNYILEEVSKEEFELLKRR